MRFVTRSIVSLCLVCGLSFLMTGCGGGPEDNLVGEYVDTKGNRVLKITSNTMTFYMGAMERTLDYKVTGTDGNKVMVQPSSKGKPGQKSMPITVTDNGIEIDMDGTVEKLIRK